MMKKLRRSSSSSSSSNDSKFDFLLLIASAFFLLCSTNANDYDPIIQLPSSGLYPKCSPKSKAKIFNLDDCGAKGDGTTDDSKILQNVWKIACSSSSPAKIVIPSGKHYLVRPTDFAGPCKSNVTLRIGGAVIAPQEPDTWNGSDVHRWLYFHGVEHLTVEGGGVINGRGQQWWARSCKTNESNPCTHAPTAITFHRCNYLKVRNLALVDSQQMHLAFTNCASVAASSISVKAPIDSPNTDGIHISATTHIELKDTTIRTGDDCISIVGNSSQIRIKNIFCGPGHGISIGSLGKANSSAAVYDVVINGAVVENTENGVRIKTWQGGSGFARKITFENIRMENVSNPIIIDQYYCDSLDPCLNQTSAVSVENISFRNIKGTSATEEAILLSCSDSHPCKRLYLEDIQLISLSEFTNSFCWEAYGKSSGLVYPSSCLLSDEAAISQRFINFNESSLLKVY